MVPEPDGALTRQRTGLTDGAFGGRYGLRMFITADDVDPELAEPYIDRDEERTTTDPATGVTVTYRYVHGGFAGTEARFSFYFPAPADYRGRFFQHTYPTVTEENAAPETIAFAHLERGVRGVDEQRRWRAGQPCARRLQGERRGGQVLAGGRRRDVRRQHAGPRPPLRCQRRRVPDPGRDREHLGRVGRRGTRWCPAHRTRSRATRAR